MGHAAYRHWGIGKGRSMLDCRRWGIGGGCVDRGGTE